MKRKRITSIRTVLTSSSEPEKAKELHKKFLNNEEPVKLRPKGFSLTQKSEKWKTSL